MGNFEIDYSKYIAKSPMLGMNEESLLEHTNKVLEQAFILSDIYKLDMKVKSLLLIAAYFHDIGKINPLFQNRIKSQKRTAFNPNIEVGHNIASIYVLKYIHKYKDSEDVKGLPEVFPDVYSVQELELFARNNHTSVFQMMSYYFRKLNLDEFIIVYYAVLEHHHYVDNVASEANDYEKIKKFEGFSNKCNFRNREIQAQLNHHKLAEITKDNFAGRKLLISGFLNRCDRAASAHMQVEYENDFLQDSLEFWAKRGKIQNHKFKWRPLQEYCFNHHDNDLLIIAPTGQGKTEAGLRWIRNNKAFFVLPLRTAINSIYKRVGENILFNEKLESRLALLHGESLSVLMEANSADEEFNQILKYDKNAKMFSLPLNITTPDQLFNYVFKHNDFELKLSLLANSKIVIDEIQAYSSELLAYLIYGLQLAASVGAKILILTATFPPFIRNLLENTYQFKGCDDSKRLQGINLQEKRFISGPNRHYLKAEPRMLNEDSVIYLLGNLLDNSEFNSYLVVCNTIKKANAIYDMINQLIEFNNLDQECNLFHSKFTVRDRALIEEKIVEHGKRNSVKKVIWVTTQVVEASLDIDFDCLITELSDLNSLFQRMGRINRHGLKPVNNPNCYVFTNIEDKYLLYENHDSYSAFIDKQIHELSKIALKNFKDKVLHQKGCILSEQDKQDLIDNSLSIDNLMDNDTESYFLKEYEEHYKFIENLTIRGRNSNLINKQFRNIVQISIIPKKIYDKPEFRSKELELRSALKRFRNRNTSSSAISREKLRSDIYNLTNYIKQCCVNIQPYELIKMKSDDDFFVDLGYEKIRVIDCEYSITTGLRYSTENSNKNKNSGEELGDSDENSISNKNKINNFL